MKKPLFVLFFVFVFSALTISSVHAVGFSVDCGDSACSPSTFSDFFESTYQWHPSFALDRAITITNSSSSSQTIGHQASQTASSSGANIAEVIDLEVTRGRTLLWSGTLQGFFDVGETQLDTLLSGATETYVYTLTMQDVGNTYKDKSVSFDMLFGYIVQTSTTFTSTTSTGSTLGALTSEVATTPQGVLIAGIAEGFGEGILGETTREGEVSEEENGEVQAAVATAVLIFAPRTWYVAVLLVLVIGVMSYFLIERYYSEK